MEGGITFHFVTDGVEAALKRPQEEAKDKEVIISGGVSVIRLAADRIDEIHSAVSPVFWGRRGTSFFWN